jgi:hypothetical protein
MTRRPDHQEAFRFAGPATSGPSPSPGDPTSPGFLPGGVPSAVNRLDTVREKIVERFPGVPIYLGGDVHQPRTQDAHRSGFWGVTSEARAIIEEINDVRAALGQLTGKKVVFLAGRIRLDAQELGEILAEAKEALAFARSRP